jgi:TatD DNase family protein
MTAKKAVQEKVFCQQIKLAKTFDLPIVIHTRDALSDTYDILKSEGLPQASGIMHSFSGDISDAMKFLELGMMISISGVVTFKKARELQEVAKLVPLDKLLIETDAPYLTPEPYRGKRNEPSFCYYTAERIAKIRNISLEELAAQTTDNAHRIFRIGNYAKNKN